MNIRNFTLIILVTLILPAISSANIRSQINSLTVDVVNQYKIKNVDTSFKKHIAIFNLKEQSSDLSKVKAGATISALITSKLSESVLFILVEREDINKIMKEISLGQTGLVDEKSAPEAGKLLGADYILDGTISELGQDVIVEIRMISTESGEIYASKNLTVPRVEVISESKGYMESMFQSKYGISINMQNGSLIPNIKYGNSITMPSAEVGYRLFKHLRLGMGYFMISGTEIIRQEKEINNQPATFNYNVSLSGFKTSIEGVIPVSRWLNLSLRGDFGIPIDTKMTIDIAGFPVYYPVSTASNTIEYKRILITGTYSESLVMMTSLSAGFDILISKRIALNFRTAYSMMNDYTPWVYEYNGARQWSDKTDDNGTFSQLGGYNFSRFPKDGSRVKFNFSGIVIHLGLSLIF